MNNLIYDNGETSIDLMTNKYVKLLGVEGLSPEASISCTTLSGYNGASFVSSVMPERKITIRCMMYSVEGERYKHMLYNIFRLHNKGYLYYYSDYRQLKIGAYVEMLDISTTSYPMTISITLRCPQPYFENIETVETSLAGLTGGFEFPLEIIDTEYEFGVFSDSVTASITNGGELDVGMIFSIYASAAVCKPKIQDVITFEWLEVDIDLAAGDTLVINTNQGEKGITLIRNNTEINCVNRLVWGSTFLQLKQGYNEFVSTAESGDTNMVISCKYSEKYGGV